MDTNLDPDVAIKQLMSTSDGWRKVAAIMINPIRLKLKEVHGILMTKDHEMFVEAEVYRSHIVTDLREHFGYKEAIYLQNRLVDEIKRGIDERN